MNKPNKGRERLRRSMAQVFRSRKDHDPDAITAPEVLDSEERDRARRADRDAHRGRRYNRPPRFTTNL